MSLPADCIKGLKFLWQGSQGALLHGLFHLVSPNDKCMFYDKL